MDPGPFSGPSGSTPGPSTIPKSVKLAKRACDPCRQRRVKCNAGHPCDRCLSSEIECSYLTTPRKRGPHSGKVINSLRATRQRPYSTTASPSVSGYPAELTSALMPIPRRLKPDSLSTNDFHISNETDSVISNCLRTFASRLYDLNPTIDLDNVVMRFICGDHHSDSPFAALVLALSAMVMLLPDQQHDAGTSAEQLYRQAFRLHSASMGFKPTLDGIATSMMLGAFTMAQGDHASAFLKYKEAIGIAELLNLDREVGWGELQGTEKERAITITSILSSAARMCSLVQGRTLSLRFRPGSRSATPHASIYLYRLRGITSLYEAIDTDMMDCMGGICLGQGRCPFDGFKALAVQAAIESVIPNSSQHEAEVIDILITKRWLQAKVWQVCVTHAILTPLMPELCVEYPLVLLHHAYAAVTDISRVALKSNGKAMAVKIRDITTVAECVLRLPGTPDISNSGFGSLEEATAAHSFLSELAEEVDKSLWVRDDPRGTVQPITILLS